MRFSIQALLLATFAVSSLAQEAFSGLRAAVLLLQEKPGACKDEDFAEFMDAINNAVSLALSAELRSGAPKDDALFYPKAQFEHDIKQEISALQHGEVEWEGEEGGLEMESEDEVQTKSLTVEAEEKEDQEVTADYDSDSSSDSSSSSDSDDRRQRRLPGQGDPFCNYMCAVTGSRYWCKCASRGGRRLEQTEQEQQQQLISDEDIAAAMKIVDEHNQQRHLRLRGIAAEDSAESEVLMARFRQSGYPYLFWEYELGQQVAEDFLRRKILDGDIPCLAMPLDLHVIVGHAFE